MKAIGRFFGSRGFRKLRRNRSALAAMGVIGAFVLLVAWIFLTQGMQALGKWTGWYDLSDRPVLGLLLPDAPQQQVAASELAGFGRERAPAFRYRQFLQWRSEGSNAVDSLRRLDPADEIAAAEVIADAGRGHRRIFQGPREEVIERFDAFVAVLDQADVAAAAEAGLARIQIIIAGLPRLEAEVVNAEAERDRLAADSGTEEIPGDVLDRVTDSREQLYFSLEEIERRVLEFKASASAIGLDVSAFEELGVEDLFDAYDALEMASAEPETPIGEFVEDELWPKALVASILDAVDELRPRVVEIVAERLDAAEAPLLELFPQPTGIRGAVYRFQLLLGTDQQGRSILIRGLYSAKIAMQVGFVAAFVSVLFGSLIGAAAAFFGGWVDHAVVWLYSTLSSIPSLVLLVVLQFMFIDTDVYGTLIPLYIAFCLTFWIGPCRVVRGEAMKLKELEYIQAATAIGFGRPYILVKHLIPNTLHLMFINFSLLFIGAIKSEVILTFLGLGLQPGVGASWGVMIEQSKAQVANDFFWQIGGATFFMFTLVLAFNIFTDALQDAFDPKHVG